MTLLVPLMLSTTLRTLLAVEPLHFPTAFLTRSLHALTNAFLSPSISLLGWMPDGQKLIFCRLLYRASKLCGSALPMASDLFPLLMSMGSCARGPFSSRHTSRASPIALESSLHLSGHILQQEHHPGLSPFPQMLSLLQLLSDRLQAIPSAMDGSGKTAMPGESHPPIPLSDFPRPKCSTNLQTPHPPHRNSFPAFPHTVPLLRGTAPPHPRYGRRDLCPGC